MSSQNDVLRVLVVDDDRSFRDSIRNLLELEDWIELVSMAGDLDEAVSMACRLSPDVMLVDYNLPGGTGADLAQKLTSLLPNTAIIMMSVETGADVVRPALLSGARDFLSKPFPPSELYAALQRIPTQTASAEADVAARGALAEGAEIVAVHSPKGGCGVTTTAINLAVAKRLETHSRVALVDLSLAYGDVGLMMDLSSSTNISDLSTRSGELDAGLVADVMVTHPSGVKVLLAPSQPQQAERVSGAQVRKILTEISAQFDYVFVDTSHDLSESVLVALDMSRSVIVVSTQDVPAVRDVKLFMDVAKLLEYPNEKIKLILNRVNSHSVLAPGQIEQKLGLSLLGSIPEDVRSFADASNRGVPIVIGQRSSPATREFRRIVSTIQNRAASAASAEAVDNTTRSRSGVRGFFARAKA
ncbi:MAG: response regulator [Chloroflexota bacterium]|nr:response regulator [Chloroflexota bacterium]